MTIKYVSVHEFKWPAWGQEGESFLMTCKNHPTAEYASKNPWTRNLHFLKTAEGFPFGVECTCPFDDLVVLVEEDEGAEN